MLNKNIQNNNKFQTFVKEIKKRILSSQYEALKKVNKELINLYWNIGKEIVAKQEAYGLGKSVVKNLSDELRKEFVGIKGFSVNNLWNMRQFYLEYYENQKLQTLSREIGWSRNVAIFRKYKESSIYLFLYHRRLRSLVKIELKIGKFKPTYTKKMSFYLSVLNNTLKLSDENDKNLSAINLIL